MTNEMKTATMIRRLMGEISKQQAQTIYRLFGCDFNDKNKGTDYGRACAYWYVKIKRNFRNLAVVDYDIALIEKSFELKKNLNKSKKWKRLMRIQFAHQSILKERTYTQIPQMAAQDETIFVETEEEPWMPFEKLDTS
jgi:hypothetical protein